MQTLRKSQWATRQCLRLNKLPEQLSQVIKTNGPISVAAYMRQCLTNPSEGYYTQETPFGKPGDFVTSPEISQMFGELVGIWFVTEFMAMGQPAVTNIIELGPGKATLLDDLLRASTKFASFKASVKEIHLLEASDKLRDVQRQKLCGNNQFDKRDDQLWYAESKYGPRVCWHGDIGSIPADLENPFLLAHEFFDAMPTHAFECTEHGWRELMVDIKDSPILMPSGPTPSDATAAEPSFHLTLANKSTPLAVGLTKSPRYSKLVPPNRIEVSPEAQGIANKIASLLQGTESRRGGSGLVIDYGPIDTIPIDTLRGIKNHKIVSPFQDPGTVDLSVDVDFAGIAEQVAQYGGLAVHGPVLQGDWLHKLGIGARATVLAKNARTEEGRRRIEGEYKRLVDPAGMGKAYKVMAITSHGQTPVGFE
ncbi:Putative uncharacterized protein [Taphrina deformans PYCC 5710]|uniref:Protein arginine methyltransferase NDUFAF7 n=1 Tax=Taphrina deformans (strain PYCC 5710 / ATCC 11124 / CBS 356.35 / IMI 108563 / JCM 9778 / NBRC 8474) TaxID=1097556 RepID=R4XBA4_TAPDE|nr:Putative uncharacterized protein [Taphrina deformans PYCC 5710]|eukprot:CCG83124.1 Putative uncharacterized protein [Taphrina deformans PYCC 5710]